MPTHVCECGARYRFADASVGKRAKCKQCGAVFTLTDDASPIPLAVEPADEPFQPFDATALRPTAATAPAAGETSEDDDGWTKVSEGHSAPLIDDRRLSQGYIDSILWTLLFPASPGDLLTFLGVWVVYGVLDFFPLVSLIALAWYCAFRFEVVESAAAGEEGLPSATMGTDIWNDYIDPFFRWMGSWLLVSLPALVYVMIGLQSGSTSVRDGLNGLADGIPGVLQAFGADPLLVLLVGLGLFLWPMVVLCLALGGFGAAVRVDLMGITIARAFPGYIATLLLLVGATIAEHFMHVWATNRLNATAVGGGGMGAMLTSAIALGFLITGASIYLDLVALRCIGLYYRHFKHRFAFRWE